MDEIATVEEEELKYPEEEHKNAVPQSKPRDRRPRPVTVVLKP